jgi:hypothetical protein
MKKPYSIHPRKPYLMVRMTEPEARDLLELIQGVDRAGAYNCGMSEQVAHYDNIAHRIRMAKVRFPRRRNEN